METRLLARHRLAPPKQAGREQKRVENGERCTVVMSLPALPPLRVFPDFPRAQFGGFEGEVFRVETIHPISIICYYFHETF